ncbi:hypothetical protein RJT34_08692 [Clitoria ternatea]|uniref:CRAL-TRIO domain-containing protein n=1 Tax=Clitoria ternatea TaxID=43366 RepID=A0AAN9K6K4_CLITE
MASTEGLTSGADNFWEQFSLSNILRECFQNRHLSHSPAGAASLFTLRCVLLLSPHTLEHLNQPHFPFLSVVYQKVLLLNCLRILYRNFRSLAMFHRWSNSHSRLGGESKEHFTESKITELKDAIGPLSGRSFKYCTDDCLRRYLEARNWNVDKSKKMLEETLGWRSAYKPENIRWDEVAMEGETGKLHRASFHDRQGRVVLILRPGMQNTCSMENQMRHLVYILENAMLNLPQGQEQMSWLIDFTGWSLRNSVPIKSAKETINILQNHYPERLAIAFLYNPPRVFEAFWKIVKFLLDTKTYQKVKFVYPNNKDSVELMKSYFDEENLPIELGGKAILNYNHEEFSRLMAQDDLKSAAFWESDDKLPNYVGKGHSGAEVAPEPVCHEPA